MMLSRRALIGKAAAGAAAALTLSAARTGVASARATDGRANDRDGRTAPAQPAEAETSASPAPWDLLSPLAAGSMVAPGWRVVDLGPVQDGSSVVVLQNDQGRSRRIHLCRNDGSPQGIVHTRRLDLVVMNEGYGELPTEEGLAQAVAAVARMVAANEAKVPGRVLAALLPHAERLRRFAAADRRLR